MNREGWNSYTTRDGRTIETSIGKLLQERGLENVPDSQVKDMLVGGIYDVKKAERSPLANAKRPNQGYYDPVTPDNLFAIDLRKLREALYDLNMGDIKAKKGFVGFGDRGNELSVTMPLSRIRGMAKPDNTVMTKEVIQQLLPNLR